MNLWGWIDRVKTETQICGRFVKEGNEDDNDQLTSWDEVSESNDFPSSRDEGDTSQSFLEKEQ